MAILGAIVYLAWPEGLIATKSELARRLSTPIMADEAIHGPHDALRAVALRACDLINIKLMKSAGLLGALAINAIAETAGIVCQIGTMPFASVLLTALTIGARFASIETVKSCHWLQLAPSKTRC